MDRKDVVIEDTPLAPTFGEVARAFGRIGCLSFGGPAGQIALMHEDIVVRRRWVGEEDYLHALNFCHLLPGPEAQQLATWIGWRLHGTRGGIAAGGLFVLPGALVMLGLSMLYAVAANLTWFAALFLGIKAAVLAIVAQALLRIAGRALHGPIKWAIAITAFVALFVFDAPFPLVVLAAGLVGWATETHGPGRAPATEQGSLWRHTLASILGWGAVWAVPMVAVLLLLGPDHVLARIGVFFSQLAVVTFGGAYAVLSYMAQEAVQQYHWLRPQEMADALGLAETTPGPLILVTQHVGFLAAYRAPSPFPPMLAGVLGAALTTWVTFAPCFLWIFAFAPWIERLRHAARLKSALAAVTAAVVGVIANLTVWFALHVLFARTGEWRAGPVRIVSPDWSSFDWRVAVIGAVAALLLFRLRWSVVRVLVVAAGLGLTFGGLTFG